MKRVKSIMYFHNWIKAEMDKYPIQHVLSDHSSILPNEVHTAHNNTFQRRVSPDNQLQVLTTELTIIRQTQNMHAVIRSKWDEEHTFHSSSMMRQSRKMPIMMATMMMMIMTQSARPIGRWTWMSGTTVVTAYTSKNTHLHSIKTDRWQTTSCSADWLKRSHMTFTIIKWWTSHVQRLKVTVRSTK